MQYVFVYPALAKLRRQAKIIVLSGVIAASLSVAFGFIFNLEYRAEADVLVISKSRYGVDPYTITKSAERIGENLVAIMRRPVIFMKKSWPNGGRVLIRVVLLAMRSLNVFDAALAESSQRHCGLWHWGDSVSAYDEE